MVVLKCKRMQNKNILLCHFQLRTFYLYITFHFSHLIIYNFPLSIRLHLLTSVCFISLPLAFFHFRTIFFHFCLICSHLLAFVCVHLSSVCVLVLPIWVVLKCKQTQKRTYYSAIFNYVHFICTSCLISLI